MAKTLTKAWGNYLPGRVLTDDPEERAEGAVLVHATRMEALERDGYFAAEKTAPTATAKTSTPPPVPVYIPPAKSVTAPDVPEHDDDDDHDEPAEGTPRRG